MENEIVFDPKKVVFLNPKYNQKYEIKLKVINNRHYSLKNLKFKDFNQEIYYISPQSFDLEPYDTIDVLIQYFCDNEIQTEDCIMLMNDKVEQNLVVQFYHSDDNELKSVSFSTKFDLSSPVNFEKFAQTQKSNKEIEEYKTLKDNTSPQSVKSVTSSKQNQILIQNQADEICKLKKEVIALNEAEKYWKEYYEKNMFGLNSKNQKEQNSLLKDNQQLANKIQLQQQEIQKIDGQKDEYNYKIKQIKEQQKLKEENYIQKQEFDKQQIVNLQSQIKELKSDINSNNNKFSRLQNNFNKSLEKQAKTEIQVNEAENLKKQLEIVKKQLQKLEKNYENDISLLEKQHIQQLTDLRIENKDLESKLFSKIDATNLENNNTTNVEGTKIESSKIIEKYKKKKLIIKDLKNNIKNLMDEVIRKDNRINQINQQFQEQQVQINNITQEGDKVLQCFQKQKSKKDKLKNQLNKTLNEQESCYKIQVQQLNTEKNELQQYTEQLEGDIQQLQQQDGQVQSELLELKKYLNNLNLEKDQVFGQFDFKEKQLQEFQIKNNELINTINNIQSKNNELEKQKVKAKNNEKELKKLKKSQIQEQEIQNNTQEQQEVLEEMGVKIQEMSNTIKNQQRENRKLLKQNEELVSQIDNIQVEFDGQAETNANQNQEYDKNIQQLNEEFYTQKIVQEDIAEIQDLYIQQLKEKLEKQTKHKKNSEYVEDLSSLCQKDATIKILRQRIDKLTKNKSFKGKSADVLFNQVQNQNLQMLNKKYQMKIDQLSEINGNLREEVSNCQQQIQEVSCQKNSNIINQYQQEIVNLQNQLKDRVINQDREDIESVINNKDSKINELQQELKRIKNYNEDLRHKVGEREQEQAMIQGNVAALEKELEKMKKSVQEKFRKEENLKDFMLKNNQLKDEINQLNCENSNLQEKLKNAKGDINRKESMIQQLRARESSQEKHSKEKHQQNSNQKKLNSYKAENKILKQRLYQFQKHLEELQLQVNQEVQYQLQEILQKQKQEIVHQEEENQNQNLFKEDEIQQFILASELKNKGQMFQSTNNK